MHTNGYLHQTESMASLLQQLRPATLLTVMGTAGTGKSRLVAEALRPRDPVWVDCALGESIPTLAPHEGIVVLDGCDGLRGSGDAIHHLLDRGSTVLATSRDVVGLPGERVLALGPLPDGGSLLQARLTEAGSPPLPGEQAARIGRMLGGLPLAIELAAGRVPDLGVEQVERTLRQRFDAVSLVGGRLVRRNTIRMVVDWAIESLDADQRSQLLRLTTQAVDPTKPATKQLLDFGLVQAHPQRAAQWEVAPLVRDQLESSQTYSTAPTATPLAAPLRRSAQ